MFFCNLSEIWGYSQTSYSPTPHREGLGESLFSTTFLQDRVRRRHRRDSLDHWCKMRV